MVWYGMVWYGMVWYGMVGMVWYGMVWYGVVWCGVVLYCIVLYMVVNATYQPIVDNEFIIQFAIRVQDDITVALEEDAISVFWPVHQFIVFNSPYLYAATCIIWHM